MIYEILFPEAGGAQGSAPDPKSKCENPSPSATLAVGGANDVRHPVATAPRAQPWSELSACHDGVLAGVLRGDAGADAGMAGGDAHSTGAGYSMICLPQTASRQESAAGPPAGRSIVGGWVVSGA